MTFIGLLILGAGFLLLILATVPLFNRRIHGLFYGWWLVGVASLVMILSIVPFFHSMTAWFVVLERRFGWSRAELAMAFSLSRVEGGVLGPLEGLLIERLGPRRMVFIGFMILGAGFLLFGQVQELWQFYAAFLVMSLGGGLGTWLPMMTVLNSWFVRSRATAMSLVLVGYRLGVVVLVPLLAWAIDNEQIGWRLAAASIGFVIIFAAFPISRLVRNRPEDSGQRPDGDAVPLTASSSQPQDSQPSEDQRDITWQEAIRTRPFWLMSVGHACCSSVTVTIMVHLGPMLTDRGFNLQTVGGVVSAYTAVGIASTFLGGRLGDRVPIRLAIFGFAILQSMAIAVLMVAHNMPTVLLFALLMGAGEGRGSLTTAIRGVYFGRKSFASIMGMSMVPMNVLLFASPLFAGYMFDTTGSYVIPFATIAVGSSLGASMFLLLGEPKTITPPRTVLANG